LFTCHQSSATIDTADHKRAIGKTFADSDTATFTLAVRPVPATLVAVSIPINTTLLINPVVAVAAVAPDSDADPSGADFDADLSKCGSGGQQEACSGKAHNDLTHSIVLQL